MASTLARRMSEPSALSLAAALAYSGANALQWPHQGASTRRDDNAALTSHSQGLEVPYQLAEITPCLCTAGRWPHAPWQPYA